MTRPTFCLVGRPARDGASAVAGHGYLRGSGGLMAPPSAPARLPPQSIASPRPSRPAPARREELPGPAEGPATAMMGTWSPRADPRADRRRPPGRAPRARPPCSAPSTSFEVVGEAEDGEAAVREAQLTKPDVVLMDVRMPGIDGVEATRRIRKAVPETAVLMLTMYDDDATVFTAMQAGARGYLLKGAEQDDIADAIRAVVRGQAIFGAGHRHPGARATSPTRPAAAAPDDPFPELTAARAGDPRAAGRGRAHRGDRLGAAPLAEDGQQQPDHHLRQARGRRPDRGGDPGPRARPGRSRPWTRSPSPSPSSRCPSVPRRRTAAAAAGRRLAGAARPGRERAGVAAAVLLASRARRHGAARRGCSRRRCWRPAALATLPAAPVAAPRRLRRPRRHRRLRRRRRRRTPSPERDRADGAGPGLRAPGAHVVADRGLARTGSAGRWCGCRSRSALTGLVYFFVAFSAEGFASDTLPSLAHRGVRAGRSGDVRRGHPARPRRRPRPGGQRGRARRRAASP